MPLLSLARFCSFVTQFVDTPARFAGRRWTSFLKDFGFGSLVVGREGLADPRPAVGVVRRGHLVMARLRLDRVLAWAKSPR